MSLIIEVTVNRDFPTGQITIRRIKGGTKDDDINTYEYIIYENSRVTGADVFVKKGQVRHRYGDSGHRLILKCLLDAEDSL